MYKNLPLLKVAFRWLNQVCVGYMYVDCVSLQVCAGMFGWVFVCAWMGVSVCMDGCLCVHVCDVYACVMHVVCTCCVMCM